VFLRDRGAWIGSATELLSQLRKIAPLAALPATPKGLSQTLPRVAGLLVTRRRNGRGDRVLSIHSASGISAKTARN
jgi:hypothetical protein